MKRQTGERVTYRLDSATEHASSANQAGKHKSWLHF